MAYFDERATPITVALDRLWLQFGEVRACCPAMALAGEMANVKLYYLAKV